MDTYKIEDTTLIPYRMTKSTYGMMRKNWVLEYTNFSI
jgi:hypothetical protein